MKTIWLSLTCCLYSACIPAQSLGSWYVEPSLSWKIDRTLNWPDPALTLPYCEIKSLRTIYPNNPFASSGGLNIGYCLKNRDKIQIGVMYDDSESGFTYTGLTSDGNQTWGGYTSGILMYNFNLLYKRDIMLIKSPWFRSDRFIRVHLTGGLTYCYKPNHGMVAIDDSGTKFTAPDSSVYTITATTYGIGVNFMYSFKINLGFDITFGKGNKEWFSLSANFIHGRQGVFHSYIGAQVEVANKNSKQSYYINCPGTGNGFYFTISRRFFFLKKRQ